MFDYTQFSEAKKTESGKVQAIVALASAIKNTFQGLSRPRRKEAWDAVTSSKGKREILALMNNPERPISRFRTLTGFKEWLETESNPPLAGYWSLQNRDSD